MIDVGTFGIPGNFAMPFYDAGTQQYDMPGLRKYLRGQLPADRYSFTDTQLDDLISGKGLPGPVEMYDFQAGEGGSTGSTARTKTAAGTPDVSILPEDFEADAEDGDDGPPPPAAPVEVTGDGVTTSPAAGDVVVGGVQRDASKGHYDPNTGPVGTFYGAYGTQIDRDTGQILPGGSFTAPPYDPSAAFAQRTGPGGEAMGSYNDLFPVYLYGGAPSSALVELDRYGLGLDFVRENPALLQQWWTDVFKPTYQRLAAGQPGYEEVPEEEKSPWNLANIVRYMANPLELLFGAGGAGPVGQAAIDAATKSFGGIDPASMQLDLPLMPDTLLGQIFGGDTGGLTITPGTSDAIINALGPLLVPSEQFGVDPGADQAILDKLGQLLVGGDQFDLAPGVGQSLIDRLGTLSVGPDQFELGTGYDASGPYNVEDKLLSDLGIINVGPDQFDINDPDAVVAALRDLIPSIEIGPENFSPANIAATVSRLKDLIPDVMIDPTKFSPTDIDATINKLIADVGNIQVGPEQFSLGTDVTQAGTRTVQDKLLADIGVVQVAPGQFELTDTDKVISKLLTDIGMVEVSPGQFALGTDTQGVTPEQKLLQDLGIIAVGPEGFQPTDTADIKVKLLKDLGMITVGVGGEGGAPGFTLDPAAAGILRDQLVSAINPLTAADFERDPDAIAATIREDIVSRIDAINRTDIGADPDQITALLAPLLADVEALPGQVEETAISPIQDLFAGLMEEGRALPETFRQDVSSPIADMIEGLRTSLTEDIGGFKVGPDFLKTGKREAGELLDLLYGTGGTGRAAGIEGFQVPPAIDQLGDRLGSFDAPDTLMGKVGLLQDALGALDLDALTAPPGLDALVTDVGQLGADLGDATSGLGVFQDALGAFSPEDQAIMGMLLNMLGPEGIASLSTQELSGLIERFRDMQGSALTDALGSYWSEPAGYEPWLDALRKGVLGTYGPIPEMEWEGLLTELSSGLLPSIQEAIAENFYKHEPTFERVLGRIDELQDLLEQYEEARKAGDGKGDGGDDMPGAAGTTGNWLQTLQTALTPKITDQKELTAEYLTGEPVTASLLEDLGVAQTKQDQELLEQLQRYGVVQSGDTVEAIPELESLQRRERMGVLSDAAQRIQTDRDAALQQGLDLGKTITTRDLGLGELTGLIDGRDTLGSRQADLDIISAVIASLDPQLKIKGDKEELSELLLELIGGTGSEWDKADWISRFKTMVMGD